jgi:DNA-binding CsgD family transcriptional regulator
MRLADALDWPLVLLDDEALVHHANCSGRTLLARGQPLQLDAQQRVQPAAPSHRPDFRLALQAAAAGEMRHCRWPGRPGGIGATLRPLAPLPSGERLVLLELKPAHVAAPRPDVGAFAQAHELSAQQQRLLQALAQGHSTVQMAAGLGLPASTLRGRLLALRRKTGHADNDALRRTLWALPPRPGAEDHGK